MVMVVAPAGAGAGVDEGEVLLPHAETHTRHKRIAKTRTDMPASLVPLTLARILPAPACCPVTTSAA